MNPTLSAPPRPRAHAGVVSWKQPVMALLAFLLFGPIFATPLVLLAWTAAGALSLTPFAAHIVELAALIVAAAPTAWLSARGWRAEGLMAQGLDP